MLLENDSDIHSLSLSSVAVTIAECFKYDFIMLCCLTCNKDNKNKASQI